MSLIPCFSPWHHVANCALSLLMRHIVFSAGSHSGGHVLEYRNLQVSNDSYLMCKPYFVCCFPRPAYGQLLQIPQYFPGVPVMALSATVTPDTLGRLQDALPNSVLVKSSANRPNIYLEAHQLKNFYNSKGGKIMKQPCKNL